MAHAAADLGNADDMGVGALVPVEEALQVDGVADLQILHGLIDLGARAAEIAFHGEGVGRAVYADVEIQVVAVLAGAVPLVEPGHGIPLGVGAGLHGHAGEGDLFIHVVDQLVGAQEGGGVEVRGDVAAGDDLKSAVDDLHLAAPLGLEAADADLRAGHQLGKVCLGAVGLVDEIRAVFALAVEVGLVVPPGLLILDVGLHRHGAVQRRGDVFRVAHYGGSGRLRGCGGFRRRGGGRSGGRRSRRVAGAGISALGAAGKGQDQGQDQKQGKDLLHFRFSFSINIQNQGFPRMVILYPYSSVNQALKRFFPAATSSSGSRRPRGRKCRSAPRQRPGS